MAQLFTNNAYGYLNAGISNSDLSLTLQSGQGALFPSPSGGDYFLVTIEHGGLTGTREIVKVTARSTDTFTIVRAQEGTSAASWIAGDLVDLRLTAGYLNANTGVADGDKGDITVSSSGATWTIDNDAVSFAKMQNIATARILGRDTAGSGDIEELTSSEVLALLGTPTPGSGLPYMYPFKDAVDDDLNDNFRGSSIDTTGARFTGASAWTALNIGASTVVVADASLWITSPASASIQIRGYEQDLPSGNWCYRMQLAIRYAAGDTTEKAVGMFIRDSVGGKVEWWAIGLSGGSQGVWANKMTNETTHSAVRAFQNVTGVSLPTFLEIEYDGTNYYFRFGVTDGSLYRMTSFAKTNFLDNAADKIGVFSENDQSVATTLISGGFYRVPVSQVF